MRPSASFLTLCFSLSLCGLSPLPAANAAPVPVNQQQDLTSLVTKLETVVFGQPRKNVPLAQRIKNLELHAGQSPKGTFRSRVDKLVEVIGLNPADCPPPVAPEMGLNRGTEKPSASGSPAVGHDKRKLSGHPRQQRAQETSKMPDLAPDLSCAKRHGPEEVRSTLLEAINLHKKGDLSLAEGKFREVLKIDPYNGDACFSLGSIAEGRGDLAAALGYYSAASVANPNDREAKDAVLQVQERISQQQGPFVNPISVSGRDGSTPVLQARAAEFTDADMPSGGVLYSQNPIPSLPVAPSSGYPAQAIRQPPMPTINIGQNPPPPRNNPGTGKAVAKGLARVAVGAALQYSGLHCPLCHFLRGF